MTTSQKNTFKVRLKELRASSGRTQAEIAKELFCSRTSLSNYESGRRMPSIDVLAQLAKYFNVNVSYLLPGSVEHPLSDEVEKRKLINFKYLIKEKYLDLSCLSDMDKMELINYYRYLRHRETQGE